MKPVPLKVYITLTSQTAFSKMCCGRNFSLRYRGALDTSSTSSLGTVDGLDIFSFDQSTLVASQSSLGELVNTLVGSRSSRLDHIQNTSLVRSKTTDLTGDRTAHLDALSESLQQQNKKEKEEIRISESKLLLI